jgi:hypothetical protein
MAVAPVKSAAASPVPEPEEEPDPLPDDAAPPDDDEVERVAPPQARASKNETPTMLAALWFMPPASKDKK